MSCKDVGDHASPPAAIYSVAFRRSRRASVYSYAAALFYSSLFQAQDRPRASPPLPALKTTRRRHRPFPSVFSLHFQGWSPGMSTRAGESGGSVAVALPGSPHFHALPTRLIYHARQPIASASRRHASRPPLMTAGNFASTPADVDSSPMALASFIDTASLAELRPRRRDIFDEGGA